uniref:Uncharacterized protein n=1 Tax=Rhizophora mucronata TaxID=61149 RepID=A0A2P2NWC2_RHIMU
MPSKSLRNHLRRENINRINSSDITIISLKILLRNRVMLEICHSRYTVKTYQKNYIIKL